MTSLTPDGWLRFGATYDSGAGTLTPTGNYTVANNSFGGTVEDVASDGNADFLVDYTIANTILYLGITININGREYAIFGENNAGNLLRFIPYFNSIDDLSVFNNQAVTHTMTNTGNNAVVVNVCFLGGTLIATPRGERLVEDLTIGDLVRTADGREVPVRWVGRQHVSRPANLLHSEKWAPVCIAAGTLGNHSDLYVSADHGMIVDDLVVNASALVNGDTIRFVPAADLPEAFTYYHIETEAHDVIRANGAPSETFIDAVGRSAFDNHQEYLDLYGADRIIREMPLPRIAAARLVPQTIKDRISGRLDSLRASA